MIETKFRAWGESEDNNWEPRMHYSFDVETDGEIFYRGDAQPEWILMQYTGIVDYNGKEIYEGDVIRFGVFDANGVVEWNDNYLCWWIKLINRPQSLRQDGSLFDFTTSVGWCDSFEVIGNLYENPELLK